MTQPHISGEGEEKESSRLAGEFKSYTPSRETPYSSSAIPEWPVAGPETLSLAGVLCRKQIFIGAVYFHCGLST